MLWLYDLPSWLLCLVVVGTFVLFSLAGQVLVRPRLGRLYGGGTFNEAVGQYLAAFGVFYGITLGLLSVGTWQNFSDVDTTVTREAAAVAGLYQTVDQFPEPSRAALTASLTGYTTFVIDSEWPLQKHGVIPDGGSKFITQIHRSLSEYEPRSEGLKALHAKALEKIGEVVELRRLRLHSVTTSLPITLWIVILAGAILNISIMWLMVIARPRVHDLLTAMLAALLGLLVFLLVAMDHPFRGDYSVTADAFELVKRQLMRH